MAAAENRTGLRDWWASPPRSGARRLISPFEYRRPRAWARVRVASGAVLVGASAATLSFGGADAKTYGWATAFLAMGAAQFAFAYWLRLIAQGPSRQTSSPRVAGWTC
jgi:hypothetical protein